MKTIRFTINDDCVPQQPNNSKNLHFDVPDWTHTWEIPGETFTTANLRPIFNHPAHEQLNCYWAELRIGLHADGPIAPGARGRMLHYEQNGTVAVWEPFGDEVFLSPSSLPGMGAPLPSIVTDKINALNHLSFRQWGVQVKGKGYLVMARLSIIYTFPDYTDEINDLKQRVAALEAAQQEVGGNFVLTETHFQQIADNMRGRLTA